MLCDSCHKQEAVIHIQEISANGAKTIHLCSDCALEKMMKLQLVPEGLRDMLEKMMGLVSGKEARVRLEEILKRKEQGLSPELEKMECPNCHTTFGALQKTHRFGCPQCADTFHEFLEVFFRTTYNVALGRSARRKANGKSHREDETVETPGEISKQNELERLKEELAYAVSQEDYVKAATLKERIDEYLPSSESGTEMEVGSDA